MKLKQLKARGFLGFKHGMGLDEITVDLSGLSGLIALTGPNGKGKTTLLELLTPYRQLASRAGKLGDHVFLRDSSKELIFEYGGAEYRSLIKIDSKTGGTEGFLFKDGESLCNGKNRDYDSKVVELFGSPELFFSSVFCAQNAAKLSDMTTGELKNLFSEFLKLDELEAHEATAKQAGGIIAGLVAGRERDAERLRGQDVEALIFSAESNLNVLISTEKTRDAAADKLTAQETALKIAQGASAQNSVIKEKADSLRREQSAAVKAWWDYETATKATLDDLRTKCRAAIAELDRAEGLASQAEALQMAQFDIAVLKGREPVLRETAAEYDGKINAVRDEIHALQIKHGEADSMRKEAITNPELSRLSAEIRACKSATGVLAQRSTKCNDPKCALIAAAVEASERMPGLEAELAALETETKKQAQEQSDIMRDCKLRTDELTRTKSDLEAAQKKARAELDENTAQQAKLAAIIQKAGDIAAAVERKNSIDARIEELKAAGSAKKTELDSHERAHLESMTRFDDLIADTEAEINTGAARQAEDIECEIATLKERIKTTTAYIASLQAQREQIQTQLAEAKAAARQLEGIRAEAQALQNEAAEWLYLQNACGKNGLRALEIDGVAPCITEHANALLRATYGPTFSVKIQTQDEDGKECFDIIVIKEDGAEVLLENLSGGQKVWVLKALRLAMTLISEESSGKDFKTAYGDEEDGALDADNAQIFVEMYRQFMKAGGFDDFLYISHRPECVGMADCQIAFGDNGITVN